MRRACKRTGAQADVRVSEGKNGTPVSKSFPRSLSSAWARIIDIPRIRSAFASLPACYFQGSCIAEGVKSIFASARARERTNEQADERTCEYVSERTNKQADDWTSIRVNERTSGQAHELTSGSSCARSEKRTLPFAAKAKILQLPRAKSCNTSAATEGSKNSSNQGSK